MSESRSRSLIPSFLYSSDHHRLFQSPEPSTTMTHVKSSRPLIPPTSSASSNGTSFAIATPNEKVEMYSPAYFAACTVAGMLCCGITHTAITPLDVIKCNMQIDPLKYKNITSAFKTTIKEQGLKGFTRGWSPTLLGYSAQGAFKYGLYEYSKKYYSDIVGPEYAAKYKTLIYLADSPAVYLMVYQRSSNPKASAGYTKALFLSGDARFHLIYKKVMPTPKEECSKPVQLGVSFAGGYIAGIFCAVISHPADNLVSFLNNSKGATVADAVKRLGLWGMFTRGLPLRIFMIGTLTGAQWVIYDAVKVLAGLPTTGGASPATTLASSISA
ncbi:Mitochondrial substrate/solute carrier [Arabidopsis thaliana x Arabidopsis arenosa]|uniref:Mitochondrial substrate/solute carrier n=1 Tax=Arabidopsis thaliana x Arabidopsis arenosa TaxID=1240361 RepID=A0A8T1ZNY4_9BRAS|nr:Mitochondrial substrate/solute carrier [Arabidopsis thaliana x Arabidopsis arenosa]